jgi:predicted PurR-regulated permease PerM
MTPIYDRLERYLPPFAARLALSVFYAALIVLIVTLLITPTPFELVYLDLG